MVSNGVTYNSCRHNKMFIYVWNALILLYSVLLIRNTIHMQSGVQLLWSKGRARAKRDMSLPQHAAQCEESAVPADRHESARPTALCHLEQDQEPLTSSLFPPTTAVHPVLTCLPGCNNTTISLHTIMKQSKYQTSLEGQDTILLNVYIIKPIVLCIGRNEFLIFTRPNH